MHVLELGSLSPPVSSKAGSGSGLFLIWMKCTVLVPVLTLSKSPGSLQSRRLQVVWDRTMSWLLGTQSAHSMPAP